MKDWTYRPEFVRDGETIKRVGPPMYVHASGVAIDISRSTCLTADMLDVEGKHDEAAEARCIAAGDAEAFARSIARRQAEFDSKVSR